MHPVSPPSGLGYYSVVLNKWLADHFTNIFNYSKISVKVVKLLKTCKNRPFKLVNPRWSSGLSRQLRSWMRKVRTPATTYTGPIVFFCGDWLQKGDWFAMKQTGTTNNAMRSKRRFESIFFNWWHHLSIFVKSICLRNWNIDDDYQVIANVKFVD